MFNKKFELITKKSIKEIIKELDKRKLGYTKSGKIKVEPNYLGTYNRNGFSLVRDQDYTRGVTEFDADFYEIGDKTHVKVIIKSTKSPIIFVVILVGYVLLSIKSDFYKILQIDYLITVLFLILIPVLIGYFSYRSDVKKSKKFLKEIFGEDQVIY